MRKYDWNEELIKEAVSCNVNYNDVLRYLGVPTTGNNTTTLKKKISKYGIDISHFTFSAKRKGKPKPLIEYLTYNSKCSRHVLKERLLKEGYKRNVCEICGISDWNEKPLTMQIHHVDGDTKNNTLENLIMICPNCHAQTENYRGSANVKVEKPKNYCVDCGREIGRTSIRCLSCASKAKEILSMDEYNKEMRGIYTTSVCNSTIDEAPMAYKPIEEIVECVEPTVDIITQIRPVYNFKAK